jgi:hypothetical protein
MNNIQWKDVEGYEECFKISNNGQVFSKRSNKILKLGISKSGYSVLSTTVQGKYLCLKVHRLVAKAFLEPPTQQLLDTANKTFYGLVLVNHKDCDKLNNNIENLEWCSHSENTKHALVNGLNFIAKGALNGCSTFATEADRLNIYIQFKESGKSLRSFAKSIGTTHHVISRIIRDYGS